MNNPDIITATDLTKNFGSLQIIKKVSFTLKKGEFVSLLGKSGSGKTTLLSLLSGLERPTSGEIFLNGADISHASENELALLRRNTAGFIFQSFQLIPTLTAWETVALPLFPMKMPGKKRRERAMDLLEQMEITHRFNHLPSALSGGEKQRVAIARALVNHPHSVFADEPTGNLDSDTGKTILDILKRLHAEKGLSLLMVTHDLDLAGSSDRIVRMQDGEMIS